MSRDEKLKRRMDKRAAYFRGSGKRRRYRRSQYWKRATQFDLMYWR